jgi:hypothetical protein
LFDTVHTVGTKRDKPFGPHLPATVLDWALRTYRSNRKSIPGCFAAKVLLTWQYWGHQVETQAGNRSLLC